MDRSPKAPLSPQEVAALQALKQNPKRELSRRHRELLLSMGLALAEGEELKLSQAGRARWSPSKATTVRTLAPVCALGVSAAGRARAAGCGTTPPSASTAGPGGVP